MVFLGIYQSKHDTPKDARDIIVLQVTHSIKACLLGPMDIAQQERACLIKVLYPIISTRKERKDEDLYQGDRQTDRQHIGEHGTGSNVTSGASKMAQQIKALATKSKD